MSNFSQLDNQLTDERDIVEDERHFSFAMIDYKFIDAGFDVYTTAFYLRVVRRAFRSARGFDEKRRTTSQALNISQSKLKECKALLVFCNIIRITPRRSPDDPTVMISSKISLIDKSKWKLDHNFRDAGIFYKKNSMLKEVKEDFTQNEGVGHHTAGGRPPHGRGWATTRPGVGHHTAGNKKNPIKKNPIKNNVCEAESFAHTLEINSVQPEIAIETAKKRLHDDIKKIPRSIAWKLSDYLCKIMRRKFIDNEDCDQIVKNVMQELSCSSNDIRDAINDAIENNIYVITEPKKFSIHQISLDLSYFVKNKEHFIKKVKDERTILEKEFVNKLPEENDKQDVIQDLKLNKEAFQKSIKEQEIITKFPDKFRAYFFNCSKSEKTCIMREIDQISLPIFLEHKADLLINKSEPKKNKFLMSKNAATETRLNVD